MAHFVLPLFWVDLPCVFEAPKEKGAVDLKELGLPDIDSDIVETMTIQLDLIDAYTPLNLPDKPPMTLFYAFGLRYWSVLKYDEFDSFIKEKTIEMNKMLGFGGEKEKTNV